MEYISPEEKDEIRRYNGIRSLKEIALTAPLRYYHLIIPIDEYFRQLFSVMTDSNKYIREAFAETMRATLTVLADREGEDQEKNLFLQAYHV